MFLWILLAFYAVPFVALAFMPRWQFLLPAALLAALGWARMLADARDADGPGSMLAMPIAVAVGVGLIAGFLGRFAILIARAVDSPWVERPLTPPLILASSFFCVPGFAFLLMI